MKVTWSAFDEHGKSHVKCLTFCCASMFGMFLQVKMVFYSKAIGRADAPAEDCMSFCPYCGERITVEEEQA